MAVVSANCAQQTTNPGARLNLRSAPAMAFSLAQRLYRGAVYQKLNA